MIKFLSFLLSITVFLGTFFPCVKLPVVKKSEAVRFAESLGVGWNLGNTLDAHKNGVTGLDTETVWHNPKTSKEMLELVKKTGFETVRIPITWNGHFENTVNYKIDSDWLDRVNEIVDYAYSCGLKVIINVHHDDNYWLIPDNSHIDNTEKILVSIWKQVSERFAEYDENLVFETMNEPRVVGADFEWYGNKECYDCINRLNESAVKTIRESGGKNSLRYILCPTYAGGMSDEALDNYVRPDDSRVIVMVHNYVMTIHPGNEGYDCETGADRKFKTKVNNSMAKLYNRFVKKGIAVIIDEFGWTDSVHIENRIARTQYYVKSARASHIPVCIWDDGGSFAMMDRKKIDWHGYTDSISSFCIDY